MFKGIVLAWMVAVLMALGLGPAVSQAAPQVTASLVPMAPVDTSGADPAACAAESEMRQSQPDSHSDRPGSPIPPDASLDASDLLPSILPPVLLPAGPSAAPRFDAVARCLPQVDDLLRPPRIAALAA